MSKSKVSKIIIEIDGKEIALSFEGAKELHKILDDLLGEKETVVIPSPYPVPYPYKDPYRRPYIYWTCDTYGNSTDGTVYRLSASNSE